jgi:UDP-N-acetyl-D-mannosaminuronic acid transferase (WecB/TagA/CpsF family)
LGAVFVFFLNLWLTPYAVLLAWGVPILWERWMRHAEVVEELVYLLGEKKETTEEAVEETLADGS